MLGGVNRRAHTSGGYRVDQGPTLSGLGKKPLPVSGFLCQSSLNSLVIQRDGRRVIEQDWPVNKDWQKGQSRPEHVNLRFYSAVLAMLVYLGMMIAINLSQWSAVESALYRLMASDFTRFDPLLALPGMLLLGVLGLPKTLQEFVRWRRARALVLKLDPIPAAPDGELGGSLTIPLDLPADTPVEVTLNCMRRVITKGKNANTRDELLWQTPALSRKLRSIKGTRLEFNARLPDQQPETAFKEGRRDIWWAVHVEVPGTGFDVVFPVPVSAKAVKRQSDFRFSEQEKRQATAVAQQPARSWQSSADQSLGSEPGRLLIDFPAGRSRKMAGVLMLVGVVFSGVVAFMGHNIWQELQAERISYFSLMVQGMILLGFSLFGPALLLGGIYMRLNRLRLEAAADTLQTTRRFLLFTNRRSLAVDQIEGLAERVIGRMGQGVASELEYAIDAYLKDGRRVRLGDGIQGQREAELLLSRLRTLTGIEHRPDPDAYKLQRGTPPGWVKWLPVMFKAVGMLIFALTVAAFFADFG